MKESLRVEYRATDTVIPYGRNARTHSPEQVEQIAASIREFGFTNPLLIGADNVVITGHGRLAAAKALGLETVPVIVLGHLTDAQRRALVVADNRIAENAGWDRRTLAEELAALEAVSFDVSVLGFSDAELDELLEAASEEAGEMLPIAGEREVSTSRAIPLLKFGTYEVPLSEAELAALRDRASAYLDRFGVLQGFAGRELLGITC